MKSVRRMSALVLSCWVLVLAGASGVSGAIVFEDAFGGSTGLSQWTVTEQNSSTASVVNNQLCLTYDGGPWGTGVSLVSTSPVTFSGASSIQLVAQKIDYVDATYDLGSYREYSWGFGSKAKLAYGHNGSHEYVSINVDGQQVFYSYACPQEWLVPDGSFIGFRLYPDKWELIRSTDGTTFEVFTSGLAAIDLDFSDTVRIAVANANDSGSKLFLDNVQVSAVPEPAILSLIGMGGLALLRRKV